MRLSLQGLGVVLPSGGLSELQTAIGNNAPQPRPLECDTTDLSQFIPPRRLRRIDHFTRMTLLAAYRALEDASQLDPLPENLGIIICTGYGPSKTTFDFLDSMIDDGAELASPLAFSHSVHNIPAGVLSMILGSPCPQTTLCQLHAPITAGLRTAALWLADGTVDNVLLGATDEATPLLRDLTVRMAHANNRVPQEIGEGSTFFLLNEQKSSTTIHLDDSSDKFVPDHSHLWGEVPISAAFDIMSAVLSVMETGESLTCTEHGNSLLISRDGNE